MQKIVSDEEWLEARREFLELEKSFQQQRDELAAKRRNLPWRRVESDYSFDGDHGAVSLAELFGDCSQLMIYHFMFHPDWDEGCKSCSFWADGYDPMIPHLKARDVALAVVSRAPLATFMPYKKRMGWRFPWVSSDQNSFNYDFDVSFTPAQIESGDATYNYRDGAGVIEEMPGLSAFMKDETGAIYHTYSTFSRGLDTLNATYQMLDLVAKGRDEEDLPYSMDWLRRHDDY